MNETESIKGNSEKRETDQKRRPEIAPADLNIFGNWKAFFKGKEFEVEPVQEAQLLDLFGQIKQNFENRKKDTEQKVGETVDLEEKGKLALEENQESLAKLEGMNDLLNELRDLIFNGIRSKTAEIFYIDKSKVDVIAWRDKPEMTSTKLNRSPIYEDTAIQDEGNCFLVDPDKGKDIEKIFATHHHKIDKFPSGRGFHAELGGLRMTFLYPDKFGVEDKTANLDEKPEAEEPAQAA